MNSKGFTLIELMIVCAVIGIGLVSRFGFVTGNSIIQTKQSCLSVGGKWSVGIQYGRLTQTCEYGSK